MSFPIVEIQHPLLVKDDEQVLSDFLVVERACDVSEQLGTDVKVVYRNAPKEKTS